MPAGSSLDVFLRFSSSFSSSNVKAAILSKCSLFCCAIPDKKDKMSLDPRFKLCEGWRRSSR